jgi:sugar lactone lactonase YvrE
VKAEQLTEACATHGEGPMWDEAASVLRWVDMLKGDVLTMKATGSIERQHVAKVAAAIRPRAHGGLVVAVERGFLLIGVDGQIGPEHTAFTDSACRMNDGGVDRQGRFFCGSMAYDMVEPRGALYRFGSSAEIVIVLEAVTISNGIAWSGDGKRMFYVDSATQRVDIFDYDPAEGMPQDRRPLVRVSRETGLPDGIALDTEGGIWVALWGGHAVHRYRADDGRLDAVVELPVDLVTACAFGGPDRDQLYITTSRVDLGTDAHPAAGAVFLAHPGVRGLPLGTFAG